MFILPVHNFPDDNGLRNSATVDCLKKTLVLECKVAIAWFHESNMIGNHNKFEAIVFDKRKSNKTEVKFVIASEQIQSVSLVNLHIDKICLTSANQLNTVVRLKTF